MMKINKNGHLIALSAVQRERAKSALQCSRYVAGRIEMSAEGKREGMRKNENGKTVTEARRKERKEWWFKGKKENAVSEHQHQQQQSS